MTDEELTQLVQTISLQYFKQPFSHKARFNRRLKTTGGRYHLADHHIDINPKMNELFGDEILCGIIKHELCHYHLHLANKGYQHRDSDFKLLLKAVGGSRFAPGLPNQKALNKKLLHYQCSNCDTDYYRQRHINTKRYVCSKCHGRLKLKETLKFNQQ